MVSTYILFTTSLASQREKVHCGSTMKINLAGRKNPAPVDNKRVIIQEILISFMDILMPVALRNILII